MKGYPVHRRGPRRKAPPADPVQAVLACAIKQHDRGDGYGVDWVKVAITLFKAALDCLDKARGDARALTVARRVHDAAYTRMAGSPDSGTPYTADRPEEPPFMPGDGPALDLELNRH